MNKLITLLLLTVVVGCGGAFTSSEVAAVDPDSGTTEVADANMQDSTPDAGSNQDSAKSEAASDPDSGVDSGVDAEAIEASSMDTYVAETSMQEAAALDSGTTETSTLEASTTEAGLEDSGKIQDSGTVQDAEGPDAGPCGGLCTGNQCINLPPPYEPFCNFCNNPIIGQHLNGQVCGWWLQDSGTVSIPAADANLIFFCVGPLNNSWASVSQELVDGSDTALCSSGQTCQQQEVSGKFYAFCQ